MSEDVKKPAYLIQGYTISDGLIIETASQTQIKNSSIEALNMSGLAFNSVMRMFFSMDKNRKSVMVSELILTPVESFKHFRGIGSKTLQEIIDKVKAYLDDDNNIVMRLSTGETDSAESPGFFDPEVHETTVIKEDIADAFKNREFETLSFNDIRMSLPVFISEKDLMQLLEELITNKILKSTEKGYSFQHLSFFDFTENYRSEKNIDACERGMKVLKARAEGKTLEEIGKDEGVSRERIRQLEKIAANSLKKDGYGVFAEDKHKYLYTTYNFDDDFYLDYLLESERTLGYLKYRYSRGTIDSSIAINDDEVHSDYKHTIVRYLHKESFYFDGKFIAITQANIEDAVAKRYCREEVSIREFFKLYEHFLKEQGLSDVNLKIDGNEQTRKNRLSKSMKILWKQNQRLRYYDILANDYTELLETLNLSEYSNIELSTRKFFLNYPKLMQAYDIRCEYELHNLLRKIDAEEINATIQFRRMPTITFGTFNRTKAMKEMLYVMAPVNSNNLAEAISSEFGTREDTVKANWLGRISDYEQQGIYSVESVEMPNEHKSLLKSALTDDLYYFKEVREIYEQLIPEGDSSLITSDILKSMGFMVGPSYMMRNHASVESYFRDILTTQDEFDIGSIHKRHFHCSSYIKVLQQLREERVIIEFEPNKYLNIRKLEQQGITLSILKEYLEQLREFLLDDSFISIKTIKNRGFSSGLDSYGLSDYFFISLIKEDENFCSRTFSGSTIFSPQNERFSVQDFLLYNVNKLGSILLNDFIKFLEDRYGLNMDRQSILRIIADSNAYYDSDKDCLYAETSPHNPVLFIPETDIQQTLRKNVLSIYSSGDEMSDYFMAEDLSVVEDDSIDWPDEDCESLYTPDKKVTNFPLVKPPSVTVLKNEEITPRSSASPKKTQLTDVFDRLPLSIQKTEEEEQYADEFIKQLEDDQVEDVFNLPIGELDYLFTIALQRYDYIGELPISEKIFISLSEYLRKKTENKGGVNPERSLPTILVISMVFCARYSEEDSRNFWDPYAKQVWGCENSSYFQHKLRRLFRYSRQYLNETLGLDFDYRSRGDVVRPVYQHAILPSYLQNNFADWLIVNFDGLMQYPPEQLPEVLRQEETVKNVPPRLRYFLQNEDTIDAAARIMARMTDAIRLFDEEGNGDAVESALLSSFERSLWDSIYQRLADNELRIKTLRKVSPKLTWQWDLENEELYLSLSRVHSDKNEMPDAIIWAEKDASVLDKNSVEAIYPFRAPSGDWETEPWNSHTLGPLDGNILILSDNFNLDHSRQDQDSSIIFERSVPFFPEHIMYFRVNRSNNIGEIKDKIDSNGHWLIVSSDDIQIEDSSGIVGLDKRYLPNDLRETGFTQVVLCDIVLPCTIYINDDVIEFENVPEKPQIHYSIKGEHKISNFAKNCPPVFATPDLELELSLNPQSRTFKRSLLSIRRNGEFLSSVYLSNLLRKGHLKSTDDLCYIDLSHYLGSPGSYTLNLVQDLKPLLDNPIGFSWLPDQVQVVEPSKNISFSPENPVMIEIEGVRPEMVRPYVDEKCKVISDENKVKLQWKLLKGTKCRFDLMYENYPIHFCWDVDRVAAWIEGGGDRNIVSEGQEQAVELHVRGKSRERILWKIEGSDKQRLSFLDAQGEYNSKLPETVVFDMLKENSLLKPDVSIGIREYTWTVFEYFKQPKIEISNIRYDKHILSFSLIQNHKLQGQYLILIRNDVNQVIFETAEEILKDDYLFEIEMGSGEYQLEIHLFDTYVESASFRVLDESGAFEQEDFTKINALDIDSPQTLFMFMTAQKPEIMPGAKEMSQIKPVLEQLALIHDENEWLKNDTKMLGEGFIRLLPSWAVSAYPLTFITKIGQKKLHVYPEKALYGGRAGRGYIEIKIDDEKMKVAASWTRKYKTKWSRLWLGIPQEADIKLYSELDELDLWPAYRCKDCSTIVASRNGTAIQLPPSVVRAHLHGQNIPIKDQFIDTVYDENVEVRIEQYKDIELSHAYKVSDLIPPKYLKSLIDKRTEPVKDGMELGLPISLYDCLDYCVAISELYYCLKNSDFDLVKRNSKLLYKIKGYIRYTRIIPAFGAANRLMDELFEYKYPYSIPGYVFTTAMAIRLKAYNPIQYEHMMKKLSLPENTLVELTQHFIESCPKLFEWSVAAAELFYIHAAS